MPEYTIKREDIMVLFKSLVSHINQSSDQSDHSINARILIVIRDNPFFTQKEIAELMGENVNTVKYHMQAMKKEGIIKVSGGCLV